MARPRLPVAKAKIIGAAVKDPQRHRKRAAPKVASLGDGPAHLTPQQKRAWALFKNEMPWLAASDAALLEIAAQLRADMAGPEPLGVGKLNLYQVVLSKLGATPVDRSKVMVADGDEEEDEFFGPN